MSDLANSLADFVTFVQTHLTGYEKGEAAEFMDRLFRALGHDGIKEAGGSRENPIAKKGGAKGKNFGDLLLPDRVLFEMKSRGKKLERFYDQIFDYWTHIVPRRPPFVILCNFDEFWIYDFNQQLFDPVEKITLTDLPTRAEALAFLLPAPRKPLFNNNRVEVTREAASDLAALFRALIKRGEDRTRAQRFVLQLLVALVSEDMLLLPRQILARLIAECRDKGESSYDLLGGLFRQMNTDTPARAGRYTGVAYFNGGLFATVDPIELLPAELAILAKAADRKWDLVKPEIFGTLFQASMDDGADSGRDERHAYGAHFTSEFDIRKVVGPTIVRPWRAKMAAAWDRVGALKEVLRDLRRFRVLDPACGSGNFLYVAFREMKRLEREILLRLSEISKGEPLETAVSIHQFHGIDIQPFAVELAKVTLMLAKEQELREAEKLHDSDGLLVLENALPLDNLDSNILCADALFTPWPQADAIIGNPPYLGAKKLKPEFGPDYVNRLRSRYPDVPGMADYCVYWFRKTHDQLDTYSESNPQSGRAGLVGTQNVRNNQSRVGGLDYIAATGTITEAVDNQPWSGDAAVNVSIVNWVKKQSGEPTSDKKTLWVVDTNAKKAPSGPPMERRECSHINSSLSDGLDVSIAVSLSANLEPPNSFNGQMLGHDAFLVSAEQRHLLIRQDPKSSEVIFPYLNGREFLTGAGVPDRYVIDFGTRSQFEAARFPAAFEWIKSTVLPARKQKAEEGKDESGNVRSHHKAFLDRWWLLSFGRPELISKIQALPRYMACSLVTKRAIFVFVSSAIRPSNLLQVFTFADDYSFGIIQSGVHWEWFQKKSSKLKSDYRFGEAIWNTFPWPQTPTRPQIEAVAREAVALRQLRREVMAKMSWSLRDLYRTLDEPGSNPLRDAHARLDTAVRAAYQMPKDADILAFLLALNQSCAAKEAAGTPITPPGLPLAAEEHGKLITSDCIVTAL